MDNALDQKTWWDSGVCIPLLFERHFKILTFACNFDKANAFSIKSFVYYFIPVSDYSIQTMGLNLLIITKTYFKVKHKAMAVWFRRS